MTEHIKTGPSLAETGFKIFEKSWQVIFMIYWFWPSIQAHFFGAPTPQETTETPAEPVPVSWE